MDGTVVFVRPAHSLSGRSARLRRIRCASWPSRSPYAAAVLVSGSRSSARAGVPSSLIAHVAPFVLGKIEFLERREHLMACAGQPDGLRSLPGIHVDDAPGPTPHVPAELASDHFLPDHVAYLVQPAQPGPPGATERAVRDVVAARFVPVAGHRSSISCADESERRHQPRGSLRRPTAALMLFIQAPVDRYAPTGGVGIRARSPGRLSV